MTRPPPRRPDGGAHPGASLAAHLAVGAAGLALIALAILADAQWFDRHFLPDLFTSRAKQMGLLTASRGVVGVCALLLLLVARPWIGRLAGRIGITGIARATAPSLLALVLAMAATEAILESSPWRAAQEAPAGREPLRRRDPRLGWVFMPNHAGLGRPLGGRRVSYAIDGSGYRVPRPGDQVDLTRPSIVFTGESIIFGHGLDWEESIPAQVGRLTGLQPANIAVEAYAPDQAYLHLADELPRFKRPVAVVTIFIPSLFGRILDDDRPHLDVDLRVHPQTQHWRLASLFNRLAPYRREIEIERGVEETRAIYQATLRLARARGATPVIVVPVYAPEQPAERAYRRRVLDDAAIPYLLVRLDPRWRIPRNMHPNAHGARVIAEAIVSYQNETRPRP